MKIKSIKTGVHRLAVKVPLLKEPIVRNAVFCEVETDDGHVGHGLTGGAYLPFAIVTAVEKEFFPVVKDMDPRDTEAIHEKVWWKLNQRSMTGVISSALSVIDIACWDIHGKHAGRTVAQLLGGARDWAPTYCTFGFSEYEDREQLVEAAKLQIRNGHRRLKMVVGVHKGGWQEDAKRVRAVRDVIGPDVELMMDANYKFNPVDARQLCRAIEDCRLTWFEEPVYQNDTRAMADLRQHTNIPISAGQNEGHRWRLRELVLHHAVEGELYGQWMIEELARHGYRLSAGTLYPMLRSMEKKGYLVSEERRAGRSMRRVYRATPLGREALGIARGKVRELIGKMMEGP